MERGAKTEDSGETDKVQIKQTLSEPVKDLRFYLKRKGRSLDEF